MRFKGVSNAFQAVHMWFRNDYFGVFTSFYVSCRTFLGDLEVVSERSERFLKGFYGASQALRYVSFGRFQGDLGGV